MRQLPNPEIGAPGFKPTFHDRPRYTLITVGPTNAGPWTHRFDIPGEEIVITPVNCIPKIHAEDTETVPPYDVPATLPTGGVSQLDSILGAPLLDIPGAGASFPPNDLTLTINFAAAHGAGFIDVTAAVVFNGVAQPSGTPVVLTIPLGSLVAIPFAGGGPGVVVIPIPFAVTAAVVPVCPGDATVTVVNPLAVNVPYTLFVTTGEVLHYPGYLATSTFDTDTSDEALWGYLFFDGAVNHPPDYWAEPPFGPPASTGFILRGCLGISNCFITKARQKFDHFSVNYIRALVGTRRDLLIQVRHSQDADAVDVHPT